MRGLLTTQVLKQLVESIKEYYLMNPDTLALTDHHKRIVTKNDFHIDIADYFDALAGISAGSWMATYLSSKGGARQQSKQIFELQHIKRRFGLIRAGSVEGLDVYFLEYGIYIYPPQIQPVRPKFRPFGIPTIKIDALTISTYSPRGLEWTLDKFLGDTRLSEVKSSLLIVAFDLNMRSTVQFVYDRLEDLKSRVKLRDIAKSRLDVNRCKDVIEALAPSDEDDTTKKRVFDVRKKECEAIKSEAEKHKETQETVPEAEKVKKKGIVRTGYVWTRTIPRDLNTTTDFEEPGIKYYTGMDYLLKDLTRASSAFPMIHPSKNVRAFYDVRHEYDLIDGAMVGNNPLLHALVWMAGNPNVNLTDIASMSIGTGSALNDLKGYEFAGTFQWTFAMVGLILDSSTEFIQSNIDYLYYVTMGNLILPNQYLRVQTVGEAGTEEAATLTQVSLVTLLPDLRRLGKDTAIRFKANIDHFVKDFIFAKCSRKVYGQIEHARERVQLQHLTEAIKLYEKKRDEVSEEYGEGIPPPGAKANDRPGSRPLEEQKPNDVTESVHAHSESTTYFPSFGANRMTSSDASKIGRMQKEYSVV